MSFKVSCGLQLLATFTSLRMDEGWRFNSPWSETYLKGNVKALHPTLPVVILLKISVNQLSSLKSVD